MTSTDAASGGAGLAPRQHGPHAWLAEDLSSDAGSWAFHLSEAAIDELERAGDNIADRELSGLRVGDVPMPSLSVQLAEITHVLLHGRGLALLRGFPMNRYSVGEAERMFAALGVHLGSLRPQNAGGDLVGHVRDVGADIDDPSSRIYQTNERQTFHTDSCDVVALLCVEKSRSGGESLVVSATAIYNEMLEKRPDLAARLFEPVATDRRGEVPPGQKPWFEIPVLSWFEEELTVLYQRQYIDSADRFADATKLDAQQVEALDMFDRLANDRRFRVSMAFEPGDIQLVHNHSLMHDRMGFVDWPNPQRRRHLLRLWLSIPGDRRLPDVFAQRYGSVEVGNRGGIAVS